MMSAMSLTTALTASQVGRLTRRFSEAALIKAAFALYALALALIPLMPSLWLLPLPILLFGLAQGINMPSAQSLLAGLAPIAYRAAFMSVNGMVLRLGQTLGPLVMGLAFGLGGTNAPFFGGAVLALAMVAISALTIRQPSVAPVPQPTKEV